MLQPNLRFQSSLLPGRYLLKLNQSAVVLAATEQYAQPTHVIGEIEYLVERSVDEEVNVQLGRIGVLSSAAATAAGSSGRISVHAGRHRASQLGYSGSDWQLALHFDAEMLYEALQWAEPDQNERTQDYFDTPAEVVRASLEGIIAPVTEPIVETESGRFSGQLVIAYADGGLHQLDEIRILLDQVRIFYLGAPRVELSSDKVPDEQTVLQAYADAGAGAIDHKTIWLQPVIFADAPTDPQPTGRTLNDQVAEANRLWNQGCIYFVVAAEPHLIVDPGLKISSDYNALIQSFVVMGDQNPALNVIEVYFVNNTLAKDGGGYTRDGKSGLAKVFISDWNDQPPLINPRVLAHELGHVLSLAHPDEPSIGYVPASVESLMTVDIPNPDHNTLYNCLVGTNPAQATSPVLDCLPQIG